MDNIHEWHRIIQEDLVSYNLELREHCLKQNRNFYVDKEGRGSVGPKNYKILLHYPDNGAIKYIMESWCMCLNWMGIETALLPLYKADFDKALDYFEPNIFITCPEWLHTIDTQMLVDRGILIGHISGGKNPEFEIFEPCHFVVDFFLRGPSERLGVPIHRMKFGANPLIHYAKKMSTERNWFYVGVGSDSKRERAKEWLYPVIQHVKNGLLIGNGWERVETETPYMLHALEIPIDKVPDYYSSTICSLNFHQTDQINMYIDCNERTLIIPACCGFQIVDHPMAMDDYYTREEMVYCNTPDEYFTSVLYFCEHPEERYPYIQKALDRTYLEHTWFDSMKHFISFLEMTLYNM